MFIVTGTPLTSRDAVAAPASGSLRVVFIDVGQGDATLVLLPGGRSLLVDAGGFPIPALQDADSGQAARFDIGERVVAPTLRAFGVRTLDTLVLTHGDPDHIGGAMSVMRLFRPRALWEGVQVPPHHELNALAAFAGGLGIERRFVVTGDRLQIGGVQVRVLHPPVPDWERQRVRNDDSVVLEIRLGDVAVVLPGDVGREGEAAVRSIADPAPVVVLKAPHHGSATSSTRGVSGRASTGAVIFSAGRANRFGHPAPPVVARYRAIGAEMFSTASDGAVILDTDGTTVQIRGWTGRSVVLSALAAPTHRRRLPRRARRHDEHDGRKDMKDRQVLRVRLAAIAGNRGSSHQGHGLRIRRSSRAGPGLQGNHLRTCISSRARLAGSQIRDRKRPWR